MYVCMYIYILFLICPCSTCDGQFWDLSPAVQLFVCAFPNYYARVLLQDLACTHSFSPAAARFAAACACEQRWRGHITIHNLLNSVGVRNLGTEVLQLKQAPLSCHQEIIILQPRLFLGCNFPCSGRSSCSPTKSSMLAGSRKPCSNTLRP